MKAGLASFRSDAVALLIPDKLGRLLVFWHQKYRFWTIPLGKIEGRESGIAAARREAFEELGIVAEEIDFVKAVYKPVGIDEYSDIMINFFRLRLYSGIIRNLEPEKHMWLRFVKANDLGRLEPSSFPMRVIAGDNASERMPMDPRPG